MTFRYSLIAVALLLGGCVSIHQWTDNAEQDLSKISDWQVAQSQQATQQISLLVLHPAEIDIE